MQQMNGTPHMPPVNIQLSPKQAVVLSAQERLLNQIGVEVQQLNGLFGMKQEAAALAEVALVLRKVRDTFLESCSRVVVAQQMPILEGVKG